MISKLENQSLVKKEMARFLKLLAIFVLPVWLFDGCVNRDPTFHLDAKSRLIAPWPTAPLTFDYRDRENPNSERYQLHDITDFLIGDSVFTGKTGNDFFIVRRSDGHRHLFATESERNAALSRDYSTRISELHPKPWYSAIQANIFFPYNLIYYFGAGTIIVIVCISKCLGRPTPNKRM